ncbi:ribosome quality control complex subunit NEMF homolog [Topomyia yanbarensis]|uniref:ribosome quality control complex subunit NEMF homolog n=1 Tax=Topomyia yanbarensis TaxID=2498891 RepID=UPI00273BE8E9|nr:ribosome quality control complex subunit NEMF homolog [Topomyia yanbarensis]
MTKTRFNTYDVVCSVTELQKLIGMRVYQIYDIDNKTYLIRLTRNEEKIVLLLESGNRFHTTAFEWPKNVAPSGFTMKLRKHLKNKRLESLRQLGVDRIVDLQFGTGEAAYHIILELYDRGNILLTDCELKILNILRPHVEGEELRFAVRERYPTDRAKEDKGPPPMEKVREAIAKAHPGDTLRTALNPILEYGASVIDHVLHKYGLFGCRIGGELPADAVELPKKAKKKQKALAKECSKVFNLDEDMTALMCAINDAETMLRTAMTEPSKGYIIQKKDLKPAKEGEPQEFYFTNLEYHPYLYNQYKDDPVQEFSSFTAAVDEFYSTLEGQKIDLKAFAQEREALKKLSNVRTDHAKRLEDLTKAQLEDRKRAELITRNQNLVDSALLAVQSALAAQMAWSDIQDLVKAAQANIDPVASCIKQLKLEINHISLALKDPYAVLDEEIDDDEDQDREDDEDRLEPMVVDVDLAMTAFANARRYYDQRRYAARKEQKTIESSSKALKNAEKKTIQTLKDVRTQTTISKARKVYWFEKFYWFISSENYLVIGGRDQQQNELIVKRYMRATDIYVHAEIQGASSVVIKNPSGEEIPPKTLLEAGTMAISYSVAWDAKVVTSAYWVKSEQVSKTAPTGEYLTTGSFMIRGKKNFLPPCHLVLGLSFMFKLEESSVERHKGERRVRNFDEESIISKDDRSEISEIVEQEVQLEEGESDNDDTEEKDDSDKPISTEEVLEQIDSLAVKEEDEPQQSDSESDDDTKPKFPDTRVKVEHDTGKVSVQTDPTLQRLTSQPADPESVIFLGDNKPYIITPAPPRKKQVQKSKQKAKEKERAREEAAARGNQKDESQKQGQLKRGQKNKMRKIKEKYKDQDEEDRKLMMDILKSAGNKSSNNSKDESTANDQKKLPGKKPTPRPKTGEVDDLGDETPAAADVDMLDSMTGQPMEEDELLFAIPVVAPYQTLHNYKFKVKLTPGTGKRGKASKTALQIFLKDKQCTSREKDLLKAVKDELLARNIPGKVKLSAPQLQKVRK